LPLEAVIFLTVFVLLFGAGLLFLASLLGTKTQDPIKFETYECGIPVEEKRDTKISVKFYLTAILFILFDIEIIFMYPWAMSLKGFIGEGTHWVPFIGMMIFIGVFVYGLFWEIKSKALEWD
jgi:NADH-quinone oxidoreductase subunit A